MRGVYEWGECVMCVVWNGCMTVCSVVCSVWCVYVFVSGIVCGVWGEDCVQYVRWKRAGRQRGGLYAWLQASLGSDETKQALSM